MSAMSALLRSLAPDARPADSDVCIIVEGCYPYVPGGVSAWIDWLMRAQPETRFSVVTLWPKPATDAPRYALPRNVVGFHHLYLQDFGARPATRLRIPGGTDRLADALSSLVGTGGRESLALLLAEVERVRRHVTLPRLFNSPAAWEIVQRMYAEGMPYGSFLHYFWAWRALLGGLLATLEFELPPARVYHTISTGYGGLLAARAALETGRPAILTEHGIYTNERRIELLMADWVADTIDKGHALDDPRLDLRDMWVRAFEAYARTCYETMQEVITLYEDNQRLQRTLGAAPEKLRVIANGIDLDRFAGLEAAPDDAPPTMALIGRVVPIKDVKTFIASACELRGRVANLRALVIGGTDENPAYVAECRTLVEELGAGDLVTFTGNVDIREWLPKIHVVVLSSLSESQPLALLEAGAAGIPLVTTNVGSCREILEGRSDESPPLGPGGLVTDLVAPEQIADAVGALLADHRRRRALGAALKSRVSRYYTAAAAAGAYRRLYARLAAEPGAGIATGE
jgi:glycosyltransferase involved in cell wall biosynthesis